jgi:tRNA A-37 threonylcarbamoyl transferase component Bud32
LVLEYLEMQNNFFVGSIPQSFVNLVAINKMDISQNNLSGKIPMFLANLSSLQDLNLSFNNFYGAVPRGGVFDNVGALSIEGNDHLCTSLPTRGMPLCAALVDRKRKRKSLLLVLKIVMPVVVVAIIILSCTAKFYWRNRMRNNLHMQRFGESIKKVSYEDIVSATNRFCSEHLIGSGSFGKVYKGTLQFQEEQVAIKIFNLDMHGAHRSFNAECEALRNVRHRNVAKIITTCSSVNSTGADFKAIVFEYMPNGNLEMWLHPKAHASERNILTLSQRINIGLDVAFALDYLHNRCASPLIHCDLKPSNILLDNDMTAYVSDFGIARFLFTASNAYQDGVTSLAGLKGSIGYIPPGEERFSVRSISSISSVCSL